MTRILAIIVILAAIAGGGYYYFSSQPGAPEAGVDEAEQAVDDAASAAENAADAAGEAAEQAQEDAADAVDAAGEAAEDMATEVEDATEDAVEEVEEALSPDPVFTTEGFDADALTARIEASDLDPAQQQALISMVQTAQDSPEMIGDAINQVREALGQ